MNTTRSGRPALARPDGTPLRVLVVDDDEDIRNLVKTLVERTGAAVRAAPNGREGLREFHAWRPDLVVLDVSMPEMTGLEVTKRLREEHLDMPVILLTARADVIDRVIGLEAGADVYVTKPFSPQELESRVRAHVHG